MPDDRARLRPPSGEEVQHPSTEFCDAEHWHDDVGELF